MNTVDTALGPLADILPARRKAGVTEDQVEQMLVRNPRALFEARKPGRA
jgi:predicted metal-dependent phosphotriesterase family hydrolase